ARMFSESKEALGYCDELKFPVVIKADGLALGKGVIIAPDVATAKSTIEAMMNEARFGDAGRRIVIEEFLRGTECSIHALVDGKDYRLLRSEEHTSELQSRRDLVCRLLLEKKKKIEK